MSALVDRATLDAVDHAPPMTMFLYERVTPSVKAGRRYPVTRTSRGVYASEVTAAQWIEAVDLETVNRAGERVPLWTAPAWRSAGAGDTVTFDMGAP